MLRMRLFSDESDESAPGSRKAKEAKNGEDKAEPAVIKLRSKSVAPLKGRAHARSASSPRAHLDDLDEEELLRALSSDELQVLQGESSLVLEERRKQRKRQKRAKRQTRNMQWMRCSASSVTSSLHYCLSATW